MANQQQHIYGFPQLVKLKKDDPVYLDNWHIFMKKHMKQVSVFLGNMFFSMIIRGLNSKIELIYRNFLLWFTIAQVFLTL